MPQWSIYGAGLVGSLLGAAGRATWASTRSGRAVHAEVRLPNGELRRWSPGAGQGGPLLIASRCHQTPWHDLPHGPLLAAQNGLGQPVPVLVCFMAVDRDANGVIQVQGPPPRLVVGPVDPQWRPVLARWRSAGFAVEEVSDPAPAQWEKTILNATVGPLCLALRRTMAEVWAERDLRDLVLAATREGAAIAAAVGVAVPPGLVDRAADFFAEIGGHQPSICRDPGELPWIFGPLLRAARREGLDIPALARIESLCTSVVAA